MPSMYAYFVDMEIMDTHRDRASIRSRPSFIHVDTTSVYYYRVLVIEIRGYPQNHTHTHKYIPLPPSNSLFKERVPTLIKQGYRRLRIRFPRPRTDHNIPRSRRLIQFRFTLIGSSTPNTHGHGTFTELLAQSHGHGIGGPTAITRHTAGTGTARGQKEKFQLLCARTVRRQGHVATGLRFGRTPATECGGLFEFGARGRLRVGRENGGCFIVRVDTATGRYATASHWLDGSQRGRDRRWVRSAFGSRGVARAWRSGAGG